MSDQEILSNGREPSTAEAKKEQQVAHAFPGPPEPPSYPPPLVFAVNIFALCIAVFCVALDNTVISTAVPKITDQFHALQDVGWYGSCQ